jgi:hypothetical protein
MSIAVILLHSIDYNKATIKVGHFTIRQSRNNAATPDFLDTTVQQQSIVSHLARSEQAPTSNHNFVIIQV